jgi:hypothetical protein
MRHLRAFTNDSKIIKEWEDYLPFVQRIINSKVHVTTGVSPAQILFGSQFDLDRVILNEPEDISNEISISTYVQDMLKKQRVAIEVAERHQRAHTQQHLADRPTDPDYFPPGSYVLLEYAPSEQVPHKLATPRRGPYRVISNIGNSYDVMDLTTFKQRTVHLKHLRPFYYDPSKVNPREVANSDRQLFDIYKIHKHKGDFSKGLSKVKFRVEWEGSPDPSTYTWEPWTHLRSTEAVHDYLRAKGLSRYIPKAYRPTDTPDPTYWSEPPSI